MIKGLHPLLIMAKDTRKERMWPPAETYLPLVMNSRLLCLFSMMLKISVVMLLYLVK